MTLLYSSPAQPPLFRPDYPKPWTHIELTPTNERIGGLEIEIEGLLRQLNQEFKPTSYLDFKRTSCRAPATFTAPVGGIKSCSGDSESTSTGSTSRSGSSVYSNTQPSGVSGSSSSSGKEKEGDGSTGDDPKENNTPGSVPNGSVKDEKPMCPLRYKGGRKNIPDGCEETFETEALAIAHGDKFHYRCPLCFLHPPPPHRRQHQKKENLTKKLCWKDCYFEKPKEFNEHLTRKHLFYEACEYGCGHRFFQKKLRELHEAICPERKKRSKTKQPQHEALARLREEIVACLKGNKEPSVVTEALELLLLDESRQAKFDSSNENESLIRNNKTTPASVGLVNSPNNDPGYEGGTPCPTTTTATIGDETPNQTPPAGGRQMQGPLAPQAGNVPPVGSTAGNDGPLDVVAVINFVEQLKQSPPYEKKRLMHSLVSNLLEADADILRDILGPASQASSNRPPKRSHPPVDPEDQSPKRQKQVNDVHGRNGNRESQSMSPSTNEESPTSPGFADIPLFQDAGQHPELPQPADVMDNAPNADYPQSALQETRSVEVLYSDAGAGSSQSEISHQGEIMLPAPQMYAPPPDDASTITRPQPHMSGHLDDLQYWEPWMSQIWLSYFFPDQSTQPRQNGS